MALVVQKFGGSSVADSEAIRRVAKRIVATRDAGNDVVVVVSAMGDTTDDLIDLAKSVTHNDPPLREMDVLLTAGERISMALLAMAVNDLGVVAHAYTGQQAGLLTDATYGSASIVGVVPERIARVVQAHQVAIIAGFQGVNRATNDVTTLGRGGSDTTAVAFAAALQADVCEIYTDVDGVFTADPRVVPSAHKLPALTYTETLEMAAHGAKILHLRAVEYARRYGVPLHVRSSFSNKEGTWIVSEAMRDRMIAEQNALVGHTPEKITLPAGEKVDVVPINEKAMLSGVSHDKNQSKITVVGIPDVAGSAAKVFAAIGQAGVNIDMIVQNVPVANKGLANISFIVDMPDAAAAMEALERAKNELGYEELSRNDSVGTLSLVGAGIRANSGVSGQLFAALAGANVNIHMISTSEIRISVVVDEEDVERGVRAVHTAFGMDTEGEAIVYGGTGR